MSIIWTIIVGFLVGLIARGLLPGRDAAGFFLTTGLGIAGAFLGAVVGQSLGIYARGEPAGIIISIAGAVALLALYRYMVPRTSAGKSSP